MPGIYPALFSGSGGISSKAVPDPYVPVDGTMNVTGAINASGSVYGTGPTTFAAISSSYPTFRVVGATAFMDSSVSDGATAIAHRFSAYEDFTTSGAKIASFGDNAGSSYAEKAYIDKDGSTSMAGLTSAFAAKTANYTVTDADYTLTGDPTGASFTFTLPTAVGRTGKRYLFKKLTATANTITIDPAGAETIDGGATLVIATQNSSREIQSDGANWIIYGGLGAL